MKGLGPQVMVSCPRTKQEGDAGLRTEDRDAYKREDRDSMQEREQESYAGEKT